MNSGSKTESGVFCKTFITLLSVLILITYGIPFLARKITGLNFAFPVPGTLKFLYGTLIVIATYLYVSSNDERYKDFLHPPVKLLQGGYGKITKILFLLAIPISCGTLVYYHTLPNVSLPAYMRVQHPSSNFPKKFENMVNPLRIPSEKEIDLFIQQVKTEALEFIPQAKRNQGGIEFIPSESVQSFLKALKEGRIDKNKAKDALFEKNLFEGRILYEINCSPCHGANAEGNGPMSRGFQLKPIDFTDSGTIEVLVEGYVFWRVSKGGPGLPVEATPWDSAMPVWEHDLTEQERWKILLALYDLVGKSPRMPEKFE